MKDNSLIHWGIPGMRWGVRRRASGQLNKSVRKRTTSKKVPFGSKKINWTPELKKEWLSENPGKIPPETITLGQRFYAGLAIAGFTALTYKVLTGK